MCPALAGEFVITEPPGKTEISLFTQRESGHSNYSETDSLAMILAKIKEWDYPVRETARGLCAPVLPGKVEVSTRSFLSGHHQRWLSCETEEVQAFGSLHFHSFSQHPGRCPCSLVHFFLRLWDFNSLTRDRTLAPAVKAPSPNHWTTRESLLFFFQKGFQLGINFRLCIPWVHLSFFFPQKIKMGINL